MSDMNIDKVLMQMRVLATQAKGINATPEAAPQNGVNFSELLGNSINAVNDAQKISSDLKTRFELGDQGVSMVDIAVASEKARISFTAMTEVRNKLVDAYKEIMSMPV
jgi:flagellar hook-basal body complex protein FliE